jgi:hypothetical protein
MLDAWRRRLPDLADRRIVGLSGPHATFNFSLGDAEWSAKTVGNVSIAGKNKRVQPTLITAATALPLRQLCVEAKRREHMRKR